MERCEFATLQSAIDAGYREPVRGKDKDTSGHNSFGYDYEDEDGNVTVTVWFTEENNITGDKGCFRAMFPPK